MQNKQSGGDVARGQELRTATLEGSGVMMPPPHKNILFILHFNGYIWYILKAE